MNLLAQIGLGVAASGLLALIQLIWLATLTFPLVFLFAYYLPDFMRFVSDVIRRRELMSEVETNRLMEGRIIDSNLWSEAKWITRQSKQCHSPTISLSK